MIASDEGNAEVVGDFLNHQGVAVNDEDELTSWPSSWQVIRQGRVILVRELLKHSPRCLG